MKESSSELRRAIAALFLGEGRTSLREDEFIKAASMKRRWFSPDNARILLENALSSGLLSKEGNLLKPNFEYEEIDIPFNYYPEESVLETAGSHMETPYSGPYSDYPFVDELKSILSAMEKGEDVVDRLNDLERSL